MGVFAAVITLALQAYVATYKLLEVQGARAGQLTEARTFLHAVKRDARQARAALPQFKRFTASDKTLILQLPTLNGRMGEWGRGRVEIAGSPTPPLPHSPTHFYVVYHPADGGGIARTVFTSGQRERTIRDEVLSEKLSRWRFRVSGSLVTIEVNERQTVHHREAKLSLRAVVKMRNSQSAVSSGQSAVGSDKR